MKTSLISALAIGLATALAWAGDPAAERLDNWPHWRGPEATGMAPHGDPPVKWDTQTNVKWKTPIPGKGSATPIVWKDQVFVVTALDTGRLPIERGLRLTDEDRRRRTIIMRLMCDRQLDYTQLWQTLGVDPTVAYAAEIASLDDLEADGLVERQPHRLLVTPAGGPLLRVIAMRFDATLAGGPRQHSRTI